MWRWHIYGMVDRLAAVCRAGLLGILAFSVLRRAGLDELGAAFIASVIVGAISYAL